MYVKEEAALEGHISGFLRYDADKEGIMGKAGILAGIAVLVLSACSWSIATEGADVVFIFHNKDLSHRGTSFLRCSI